MGRYDRPIATAQRMLKDSGKLVTWRIVRNGSPADAGKPWKPTQPVLQDEHYINICFFPLDKQQRETYHYLKNSEVPATAMMGYMGAVAFSPSLKDIVIYDGKELMIDSIDILAPNGQPILYTLIMS